MGVYDTDQSSCREIEQELFDAMHHFLAQYPWHYNVKMELRMSHQAWYTIRKSLDYVDATYATQEKPTIMGMPVLFDPSLPPGMWEIKEYTAISILGGKTYE